MTRAHVKKLVPWGTPVTPALRRQDRRVPEAHWPARRAKLVNPRQVRDLVAKTRLLRTKFLRTASAAGSQASGRPPPLPRPRCSRKSPQNNNDAYCHCVSVAVLIVLVFDHLHLPERDKEIFPATPAEEPGFEIISLVSAVNQDPSTCLIIL